MWYPNYSKQYCTADEELPSWNLVLYPVSQFPHYFPGWLDLIKCQKTQRPKTCRFFQVETWLSKVSWILRFTSTEKHPIVQKPNPIKKTNVDLDDIINKIDDANRKAELRSCQNFLVNSERERVRHKIFNYAIENIRAKIVDEKLDHFFNNLQYTAKVNIVFGLILKTIEIGGFRYFYARENITLLDRSKFSCTTDDLTKLKDILNKTDVIASCSRQRMNTTWKIYKLTNLTVFAALFKHVPMGWKDAILPKPLLRNGTINCVTFKENTI